MKYLLGLLLFLSTVYTYADNPLLVVVIMVKNEATVIKQTLQPFADSGVTHFFVFDTGSTDGTQQTAQDFFFENNITNGIVAEEPFVDFSTSRNRALALTKQAFPDATFMLMIDAEWYTSNVPGLLQFCEAAQYGTELAYLIRITDRNTSFYTTRLIRCSAQIEFEGVVHEWLNKPTHVKVPADVYFYFNPAQRGCDKTRQRWIRDRDLLVKSYQQDPYNPRTVFFLAQTDTGLGDLESAYAFYYIRSQLKGGSVEEDYLSRYRMGEIAIYLSKTNGMYPADLALKHYLDAFSVRPWRAEPLIKIAQHYWEMGNMHLCFLFARRACELPYPEEESFCVENTMYDFTRYDFLSACAYRIGEFQIGYHATLKALQASPDMAHLHNNLSLYRQQLQITSTEVST